MKNTFKVKNWAVFQHYKDRNPPWIKLHNHLLDDYEFECLPDATKSHLLCIWMLASRTNNEMIYDNLWVKRKIGANSTVDLKSLLDAGFIELQGTEQDASKALVSEEKRREEAEAEEKTKTKFSIPTQQDVYLYMLNRGFDSVQESEKFIDYYTSNGWMVGRNKMKDWNAAVRNWLKGKANTASKPQQQFTPKAFSQ